MKEPRSEKHTGIFSTELFGVKILKPCSFQLYHWIDEIWNNKKAANSAQYSLEQFQFRIHKPQNNSLAKF